jgi:hypothetical protein
MGSNEMTRLQRLYEDHRQSPWLDNLARPDRRDGTLARLVAAGMFVSIEVAPELAFDSDGTVAAARALHDRIAEPHLYVKIPTTAEGVPAIEAMVAEGRIVNVTLIFSRTIDADVEAAAALIAELGVDMDDVGCTLEREGVAAFGDSFAHVLATLEAKARRLAA